MAGDSARDGRHADADALYSALQLKAIDAVEAQHPATWGAKLYEQVKYVTKTAHFKLITGVVTSRPSTRPSLGAR